MTELWSSALLLTLADRLFTQPVVTVARARKYLKVTRRSAALNVEKLVSAGILREQGTATYGKDYVADRVIQLASGDDA